MKKVVQALDVGEIQANDAFRLTGLYGSSFDNYANRVLE